MNSSVRLYGQPHADALYVKHLQDEHGVWLTRREAATITLPEVEELWAMHGPHKRCGASMREVEDAT